MIVCHTWRIESHAVRVDTVIRVYQQDVTFQRLFREGTEKMKISETEMKISRKVRRWNTLNAWTSKTEKRMVGGWREAAIVWERKKRQDGKTNRGMYRGGERGWGKHIKGEITEMEGWKPEQEESSREHNLWDRNGTLPTVVPNSPVSLIGLTCVQLVSNFVLVHMDPVLKPTRQRKWITWHVACQIV